MQDNDIVLCDGDCGRAYHEQCLQPRIHVSELPEEEGWLCHACDAKVAPKPSCYTQLAVLHCCSGLALPSWFDQLVLPNCCRQLASPNCRI